MLARIEWSVLAGNQRSLSRMTSDTFWRKLNAVRKAEVNISQKLYILESSTKLNERKPVVGMKCSNLNPQLKVNFDSTLSLEVPCNKNIKPFRRDNFEIDKLDVEWQSWMLSGKVGCSVVKLDVEC